MAHKQDMIHARHEDSGLFSLKDLEKLARTRRTSPAFERHPPVPAVLSPVYPVAQDEGDEIPATRGMILGTVLTGLLAGFGIVALARMFWDFFGL